MLIFQVRYDKGGGKKSLGARFGPQAIKRVFQSAMWRGAENGTPHPDLHWVDPVKSPKSYYSKVVSFGCPFITLSGDNSCSFETVRIVAKQMAKHQVALAVVDAHPDACDFSHDPHASWVRRLWEEDIVLPQKTIFFGIRDPEQAEIEYIKQNCTMLLTPDDVAALYSTQYAYKIEQYASLWQPISTHALVIVVDIDVLDPSCAPGTGVLRSGGLSVRHVLHLIQRLCALPFLIRVGEICEVIPQAGNTSRPFFDKRPDPCNLTVLAAEAIFRQMIYSMAI